MLALVSPRDKHHTEVVKLLDELTGEVKVSPYSFIELNLLLKSGEIIVKDVIAFYDALDELLEYRRISTFPTKLKYHSEAYKLREKYKSLTYFDSLHAAVGITEDLKIVSYDREYEKIEGLKYNHPRRLH